MGVVYIGEQVYKKDDFCQAENEANVRRWPSDNDSFSVSLLTKPRCVWSKVVLEIK